MTREKLSATGRGIADVVRARKGPYAYPPPYEPPVQHVAASPEQRVLAAANLLTGLGTDKDGAIRVGPIGWGLLQDALAAWHDSLRPYALPPLLPTAVIEEEMLRERSYRK